MATENTDTTNNKAQCADCFAWIKRDESHTCKRQIKRNQKGQRRGR